MIAATRPTPLADALPGMVLSEPLHDAKGNVLLGAGMVLTETMLASLARHGIALLPILGAAAAPALPDPAAVQARLAQLFRRQPDDDAGNGADVRAGAALRRYVEAYRLNGSTGSTGTQPGAAS